MLMKMYLINNSSRIISSFGKVSPCTSGWISSVLVSRKYVDLPNAEMTDFSCLQLVALKSQPQHLPFWAQVHRNTGDKICNLCKLKVMLWFETPKSDVLPKVKAVDAMGTLCALDGFGVITDESPLFFTQATLSHLWLI